MESLNLMKTIKIEHCKNLKEVWASREHNYTENKSTQKHTERIRRDKNFKEAKGANNVSPFGTVVREGGGVSKYPFIPSLLSLLFSLLLSLAFPSLSFPFGICIMLQFFVYCFLLSDVETCGLGFFLGYAYGINI